MDKTVSETKLRIAAVGDIHIHFDSKFIAFENYERLNQAADILLLAGDLTNLGAVEEAKTLASLLKKIQIPVAGVFGNHDYQSDKEQAIRKILKEESQFIFLDETPYLLGDINFVGVKGFAGGFDNRMLAAFGEPAIKTFVREAMEESLKLDTLLSQCSGEKKVVLMHYSPIKETCVGEPEEIYSFLGSSHLVEPINNHNVNLVLHGHAHYGTHAGKTLKNIPVYNVSLEVLKRTFPENPLKIFEI